MRNTLTQKLTQTIGSVITAFGLLGLMVSAEAQAVYVPSRLTDLAGGQNIKSGGPVDRPGYFGMQNLPPGLFSAGTTATCGNYRVGHGVFSNVNGLRLLYTNAAYGPTFTPALANTTTITVRAAVEINGVTYPIFFNGSRNVNIDWGGYVVSDPLSINVVASAVSNVIYSRTEVTVPTAGLLWPTLAYSYSNTSGVSGHVSAAATDLTLSTGSLDGVNVAGGSSYVYGPSMILARKSGVIYSPAVAIMGDSVASQANDVSYAGTIGWPERACLAAGLGCIKVSIATDGMPLWLQDINHSLRGSLIENCGYCIDQMGVNDLGSNADIANQQSNCFKNWNYLAGMGMKVYKSTTTPNTSSTDGYLTGTNQSFTSPSGYGGTSVLFVTGTVAAAPAAGSNTLSVSVGTATATNGYAAFNILMTSGAAKGKAFGINANTAGTSLSLTLNNNTATWAAPLPAIGDTFEISTDRVCLNDWYRQVPFPLTGIIDAADAVECNSAGVQTRNGGFWWTKPVALYSGRVTVQNGQNATIYNLGDFTTAPGSTAPSPLYSYQGDMQPTAASVLTWTSGTQVGRSSSVPGTGFTAGGGNMVVYIAQGMLGGTSSPYTAYPAIGDTYTISNCIQAYGNNGPHPGTSGHEAMAIASQPVLATFK